MTSQTIVFIPSQLLTVDLWAPQLAFLGDSATGIVADNGRHDTIGAIAQSILDDLPGRFGLVALGMGGFVAFEMQRRAPERIERLMLINTLATADTAAQTERRLGYLRLVEAGKFDAVVEERLPALLHPDHRADPGLVALARKMAAETGAERFLRQQRAIMGRSDSTPTLATIDCPTRIVHGTGDGITTLAHHQAMLAGIPHARLHLIEEGGHLLPLECPDAINAIIAAWMADPAR